MEDLLKNEIIRIELAPENTSKERLIEIIKELSEEITNNEDDGITEATVEDLKSDIDGLTEKVQRLKEDNSDLEQEKDELESRVESLLKEIDELKKG